ncbi:MAG: type II toxin-antitoxin system YafQ family toxin [Kiritimatiellaeota bacterium]|nr:type II toxin-antitoxin system YafQ family toxin [Kiritimatiellota bacterium]
MSYQVVWTSRFKRDYKLAEKRRRNMPLLHEAIARLAGDDALPARYQDHALTGHYAGFRECHIQPDWLLVYRIQKNILTLTLFRTGSHSDLF